MIDIALLTERRFDAKVADDGDWYMANILRDDGLLQEHLATYGLSTFALTGPTRKSIGAPSAAPCFGQPGITSIDTMNFALGWSEFGFKPAYQCRRADRLEYGQTLPSRPRASRGDDRSHAIRFARESGDIAEFDGVDGLGRCRGQACDFRGGSSYFPRISQQC